MRPSRHFLVFLTTTALCVFLSIAGGARSAFAQESAPKPDFAAAKKHYANAEAAAQGKDWSTAAKEYGIAYEITKDPVLFFKLGNAYQLSGDCTRAVEYFERYLAEAKPSEEYQEDTKLRISTCNQREPTTEELDTRTPRETTTPGLESAATEEDTAEQAGDSELVEQPTFMDDEPTWQETAAWSSVGVSFAFLSVSAILGLSANSREEDIDNLFRYRDSNGNPTEFNETIQKRYDTLIDEGERLSDLSLIALGLAGVSTASAIVFFVLDSSVSPESEGLGALRPTITKDSLSATASWTF